MTAYFIGRSSGQANIEPMKAGALCAAVAAALFSPDALAWGLQTHVYIAQWMLAAAPLADPQLRAAVQRLPRLVLAGACLPDLAIAGRLLGVQNFRGAHQWRVLRRLSATCWDEERAVAAGYASHLLADVVAHNDFVPEHERRLLNVPHLTHALCEWAMDEHLRPHLTQEPPGILLADLSTLAQDVARVFRCGERLARRAIVTLARAERVLRLSRVPSVCAGTLRAMHGARSGYFNAYIDRACALVRRVEAVLRGEEPLLQPEIANDAAAITAPSSAPATTSLG